VYSYRGAECLRPIPESGAIAIFNFFLFFVFCRKYRVFLFPFIFRSENEIAFSVPFIFGRKILLRSASTDRPLNDTYTYNPPTSRCACYISGYSVSPSHTMCVSECLLSWVFKRMRKWQREWSVGRSVGWLSVINVSSTSSFNLVAFKLVTRMTSQLRHRSLYFTRQPSVCLSRSICVCASLCPCACVSSLFLPTSRKQT